MSVNNRNIYNLINLPDRLFKYYPLDFKLIKKRLSGEIYLASPYDFNDPCDCQREVINNSSVREMQKYKGWLKNKLEEIGYSENDSSDVASSLLIGDDKLKEVHKKQLEHIGVLCLTLEKADSLMWGYYANNEGFCIEYDTSKIIKRFVIGFVNALDYETTRILYDRENYYIKPELRTKDINKDYLEKAIELNNNDLQYIFNTFINEQDDNLKKLNFLRNVFLKRVYAQSIKYKVDPDGSPSLLFFDRSDPRSFSKYYNKTKTWAHEKEFRFIASLGGRKVINLGIECIKNIYLGCNMSNENIISIMYLISILSLKVGLYKMVRLKNGGLAPRVIKWQINEQNFKDIDKQLLKLC